MEVVQQRRTHSPTTLRISSTSIAVCTADVTHAISNSPFLKTLIAGGTAGALSRTATAPLDRMKVLAQEGRVMNHLRHSAPPTATIGARDLFRYVYHTEGLMAFWRGNGANCLKAGPEQAAAFTVRQMYIPLVCNDVSQPTFRENCTVGALAGLTAQVLLYPMELIKTRMAVADAHEYRGILDCFRQSIRKGGVRELYTGLTANAIGIIPHRGLEMGTFFTLERIARRAFHQDRDTHHTSHSTRTPPLPLALTLLISFAASMVSQIVTYPLNLARTKLQTQGVNGRPLLYRGVGHCMQSVVREHGVRGLFAGIGPNMMKSVPASMIMYVTFSRMMALFDERSTSHNS